MDQSEESNEFQVSRMVTGILRGIMHDEEINLFFLVQCGESPAAELRPWFDQIVRANERRKPFACRPWRYEPTNVLMASTANEVCLMLLREAYHRMMPDMHALIGDCETENEVAEKLDEYLGQKGPAFEKRWNQTHMRIVPLEWSTIIADADIERATLQAPDEDEEDPFSIGRKTSDWKTLNPQWTEKMFEGLRNKNRNLVQDSGGRGRGPWQFKRSLCRANNLKCPEFETDIS